MGEEKKELVFRYGAYWGKKGEYYEALCPECKKALNIFGGKKQVSLTNLFCPECKKVRPLYIGDGIPITIHKAVELLEKAEKKEVKPEYEEETRAIGNGLVIGKINDVLSGVDEMMARLYRLDSMDMNIQDNKNLLSSDIGARLIALSKALDVQTDIVRNNVRECRNYLDYEIKKATGEIDRNIVSYAIDNKEFRDDVYKYLSKRVIGTGALITFAFGLGGIIIFAIMRLLD